MNLRPIEPHDLNALFDLRAATRENSFSRDALRQIGITEESMSQLLRTTHRGWLCEEREGIIGFAIGDGNTGELSVIAVLPGSEGRGVGSRLLAVVEQWLFSRGHAELWLWTSSDPQKRAFPFYIRHGWTISWSDADLICMRKKNHS